MIVAISGNLASGKDSFALFLKEEFKFETVNLVDRYAEDHRPELNNDLQKLEVFYDSKYRKMTLFK